MRKGRIAILAFLAAAVTAGALWITNRSIVPRDATWEDIAAEAEKGGCRHISTDDLWRLYREKGDRLLLVDTRQEWEYRTGHIKGAVNFLHAADLVCPVAEKGRSGPIAG